MHLYSALCYDCFELTDFCAQYSLHKDIFLFCMQSSLLFFFLLILFIVTAVVAENKLKAPFKKKLNMKGYISQLKRNYHIGRVKQLAMT